MKIQNPKLKLLTFGALLAVALTGCGNTVSHPLTEGQFRSQIEALHVDNSLGVSLNWHVTEINSQHPHQEYTPLMTRLLNDLTGSDSNTPNWTNIRVIHHHTYQILTVWITNGATHINRWTSLINGINGGLNPSHLDATATPSHLNQNFSALLSNNYPYMTTNNVYVMITPITNDTAQTIRHYNNDNGYNYFLETVSSNESTPAYMAVFLLPATTN